MKSNTMHCVVDEPAHQPTGQKLILFRRVLANGPPKLSGTVRKVNATRSIGSFAVVNRIPFHCNNSHRGKNDEEKFAKIPYVRFVCNCRRQKEAIRQPSTTNHPFISKRVAENR